MRGAPAEVGGDQDTAMVPLYVPRPVLLAPRRPRSSDAVDEGEVSWRQRALWWVAIVFLLISTSMCVAVMVATALADSRCYYYDGAGGDSAAVPKAHARNPLPGPPAAAAPLSAVCSTPINVVMRNAGNLVVVLVVALAGGLFCVSVCLAVAAHHRRCN